MDEKRRGLYFEIGDKRAWDKTSQALREGQAEIRERLAEEDPDAMKKLAEYQQVISEQTFFAYACQMLESLYHSDSGESGIAPCSQTCPHARRRQTLNAMGADPRQVHMAMQSIMPATYPSLGLQQPAQIYAQPCNEGPTNQGNFASSLEPLPFQQIVCPPVSAPAVGGDMEPLPYSTGSSNSNNPNSLDPLPYKNVPQRPGILSSRNITGGSVFSLRKYCSEDIAMSSDEGKMLMEQLNTEVDDLLRRKSVGLIQIETTQAFEDLVFEDDSMDDPVALGDPWEKADSPTNKRGIPKTAIPTRKEKHSLTSKTSSTTRSSDKSNVSSLMNMSILTLDDATPDWASSAVKQVDEENAASSEPPKRRASVRFSKYNMSLMSLDDRSFSQLVDCISEPERNESDSSMSRKAGFPMRRSVAKKYLETPPVEVGAKGQSKDRRATTSTLTMNDGLSRQGSEFAKLAGTVENPNGIENSLRAEGMSISKLSILSADELHVSTMSLNVDDLEPDAHS